LNPQTFHEFNEGFDGWGWWLLRLFLGFLHPVESFDMWALFDLWSEGESLLLPINAELDFSSLHMNVCIHRAQERPC
jgi:hypothetical protein